MATKFNTVTETVTAIQFTFDVLKDIYLFLDMRDVSYAVKNRVLTGMVTDSNGVKLAVNKTDWIVKDSSGNVPIWKDVNEELPECEGIYYGKEDNTNSMWKVIFRNNEWYLSGYPEHKMDVIKWTELY